MMVFCKKCDTNSSYIIPCLFSEYNLDLSGFFLLGWDGGGVPPPAENLLTPPPPLPPNFYAPPSTPNVNSPPIINNFQVITQ